MLVKMFVSFQLVLLSLMFVHVFLISLDSSVIWWYENRRRRDDWQLTLTPDWSRTCIGRTLLRRLPPQTRPEAQDGSMVSIWDVWASFTNSRRKWRRVVHLDLHFRSHSWTTTCETSARNTRFFIQTRKRRLWTKSSRRLFLSPQHN